MRRRPKGHVEHRGSDRWRLSIELAPDPLTGERRRASKTVRAATRSDAVDELAEFVRGRADLEQAAERRTVNVLCDAWLDHVRAEPGTIAEWTGALRRYVRPHIGHRLVTDVDVEMLDRLWQQLQRTGGHDGGALSASTVSKARQALRMAFSHAARWKWVTVNPVVDSTVLATTRHAKVNAPEPADVARIVAAVERLDADLATWLRLVAHLGARKEEGLGLRWSSIDLDAGTVTIRTVVTKAGSKMVVVDHPKNASSIRTVAIAVAHVAALRAMRARQIEGALKVGVRWSEDRFVMTPDPVGMRPYYPTSISRRLRVLEKRHTLPRVTIRQLRHHMATQAIARGHDVRTVAGRGGWANPDTLLRVYADWVPARDRALADDLDTEVTAVEG